MNNQTVQQRKRPSVFKVFMVIFLVLIVGVSGAAWFGWTKVQIMLEPVSDSEHHILVNVPRGSTTTAIGDILEKAGLIHNSTAFRMWLRYYELDGKIQAGDYILSPSLSLSEIVDKLIRGDVHRETLRFTVPEGLFLTDIAERLSKQGLVDEERFLDLVSDLSLWQDYWFVQDIPQGLDQPLEGYLFPDTYEIFAVSENREELIIALMLRQFRQVFTQDMRDQADSLGMSIHQVVTLASIVEKEAVVDHERPLIAGVFMNRMDIRMRLQSCATVNYILGDFSIRTLTTAQTSIPSPYNTYQNLGLPPGPISSVGKASLVAVLWPEDSDYLYFRAKDDGTNEHYFARTYAEHQENGRRAKSNANNR